MKSLKKGNATVASIIAHASLIQNALSRCSAMSVMEGTMDGTTDITVGYGEFFSGYFHSILFMSFEVQVWQRNLGGIMCWTIFEVRGYKASLASWSALTDSMFEDDEDERRQAFASYSRWKRQQEERSHWVARSIRGWFSGNPADFDRPSTGIGGDPTDAGGVRNSGTQTDLEAPSLESSGDESETDSAKRVRYRHLSMDEASNPDLWMQIHHEDMDVDHMDVDGRGEVPDQGVGPDVQPHPYPVFHDMHDARDRAFRTYERLRQEAVDRNDLDTLDALERQYEWLHYVYLHLCRARHAVVLHPCV